MDRLTTDDLKPVPPEERPHLLALEVLNRAMIDLRGAAQAEKEFYLEWFKGQRAVEWCDTAGVSVEALRRRAQEVASGRV